MSPPRSAAQHECTPSSAIGFSFQHNLLVHLELLSYELVLVGQSCSSLHLGRQLTLQVLLRNEDSLFLLRNSAAAMSAKAPNDFSDSLERLTPSQAQAIEEVWSCCMIIWPKDAARGSATAMVATRL